MKRKEYSVLLAGLLALGLTACAGMRDRDTAATTTTESATGISYGTPATSDTGTGTTGDTAGTASTATGTADMSGTAGQTTSAQPATGAITASATPNSVVTMIEVVPRQGDATGTGTMAGAAVGGTAAATSDRVYRITLRMDDGSTRVITQEWAPTFRSGDRVHLGGGEIQRR